jgi:alanyl aminopeptidase
LLTETEQRFALTSPITPLWLHPNADERGYYRWTIEPARLAALVHHAAAGLNARERVGLLNNLSALLYAREVHADQFLRTLQGFSDDPEPEVVRAVLGGLAKAKLAFLTPDNEAHFAAYVRATLTPALRRIDEAKHPSEAPTVTELRPQIFRWLGDEGRDEETRTRARVLARSYLATPTAIDPAMIDVVLHLAALQSDRALFDEFLQRFESAKTPGDRQRFLAALGSFRDPDLVDRALRYSLTGPLRPQEVLVIARGLNSDTRLQERVYTWIEANYQGIAAKLPRPYLVYLPHFASGCSRQRLEAAQHFFAQPEHAPQGTERELAKVSDQVLDCVDLREHELAAAMQFWRAEYQQATES